MIDAIEVLKNHKGLKSPFQIYGLKHINVVCGKNNSGKTSILEAIQKINQSQLMGNPGFSLENDNISKLFNKHFMQSVEQFYPGSVRKKIFSDGYDSFISDLNSKFRCLTVNDTDKLVAEISNIFSAYFPDTVKPRTEFYNFIHNFFSDELPTIKPVLIPAERNIKVTNRFGFNELDTTGSYLVSNLFNMKNKVSSNSQRIIYDKIQSRFNYITGFEFDVNTDNHISERNPQNDGNLILQFKVHDNHYDGDSCGYGLLQVLLLITFTLASPYNLIMIEEPENNLHPEMQKKLLNFLKGIPNKQFLISTHSNTMIDMNYVDQIYYVWYDGKINIEEKTNRYELLSSIGYSIIDNLTSDLIILVEGPNDLPVIQHMLDRWEQVASNKKIGYGILCGSNMQYIDLSLYKERSEVFILFDRDPQNSPSQEILKKNCDENNIYYHQLDKYAVENYFTHSAINEVFETTLPTIDPMKKIKEQVPHYRKSRNLEVIHKMAKSDIENTDLYTKFIAKVIEYINK